MNKRIARVVATTALAAGVLAVPAAGSAFADTRGSEQFYNHEVQASTSHVSYSESTTYYAANDWNGHDGQGQWGHDHHQWGHGRYGLLGLGILGL
ncbi:hypothetical protein ACIRBX_36705 [Kitasatospora sp. NPDC096147]|uniref:hypothetical protein n=1 Tax=Kitasatospora sp. NPDC096147 TaxID=3364093 RepID=UPI0037FC21B4